MEADKEGVLTEKAIKLMGITRNDIGRKSLYYNYLDDNNLKYSINPYSNTGIFSLAKLFENNIVLILFLIFTFISADLILSEVGEGSYKIAYTQSYERGKIYFSKIIAMILSLTLVLLILLLINFTVNTIANGTGDFKEPFVVSKNISNLSLDNENMEFKVISTGKSVLLNILLLISVIFFNIAFISTLSVFTDSITKTIGIEAAFIIFSLLLREFLSTASIVHAIFPYSYIFVQDVIIQRFKTNYNLGILLNIGLAAALAFVGYKKFIKKDFIGSKA